uniref:Si:dkey-83m22.7 n=1 Tax=Sinocyclocheilus anshuiensis TaxID=1608454 RepID=A0A671SXB4_9TELE
MTAYQPVLPCVNKYLQYRWDKNCYEMHRNKVKSAKPTINTTPPKTYNHLLVKLKKRQLEEERISRINRENHMLLDKMSHIMQTGGGVDCRNDYVKKSLGSEKRQLELLRISKENQCLLQRLSTCRPRYSVQVWHEQWLRNLQLMETIGRYPRLYTAQCAHFEGQASEVHEGLSEVHEEHTAFAGFPNCNTRGSRLALCRIATVQEES